MLLKSKPKLPFFCLPLISIVSFYAHLYAGDLESQSLFIM
jgi:hypothetical protein